VVMVMVGVQSPFSCACRMIPGFIPEEYTVLKYYSETYSMHWLLFKFALHGFNLLFAYENHA
jgi:hypothetical protein